MRSVGLNSGGAPYAFQSDDDTTLSVKPAVTLGDVTTATLDDVTTDDDFQRFQRFDGEASSSALGAGGGMERSTTSDSLGDAPGGAGAAGGAEFAPSVASSGYASQAVSMQTLSSEDSASVRSVDDVAAADAATGGATGSDGGDDTVTEASSELSLVTVVEGITPQEPGRASPNADSRASPNADGRASPNTDGHASPSADGHASPSADGRASPSADGRASPNADGRASPSADGRTSPNADGRTSPNADDLVSSNEDGRASPNTNGRASVNGSADQSADGRDSSHGRASPNARDDPTDSRASASVRHVGDDGSSPRSVDREAVRVASPSSDSVDVYSEAAMESLERLMEPAAVGSGHQTEGALQPRRTDSRPAFEIHRPDAAVKLRRTRTGGGAGAGRGPTPVKATYRPASLMLDATVNGDETIDDYESHHSGNVTASRFNPGTGTEFLFD